MTYRIEGLAPAPFEPLFALGEAELAARNAVRLTADDSGGFPCRISLEDAAPGEELILLNHVSHDVAGPFRTAYGIFVRKGVAPAFYQDETPAYLEKRTLSLRGFDEAGMLMNATLAMPGEADMGICELLTRPDIATIHAHNAAFGCFLARIERN